MADRFSRQRQIGQDIEDFLELERIRRYVKTLKSAYHHHMPKKERRKQGQPRGAGKGQRGVGIDGDGGTDGVS